MTCLDPRRSLLSDPIVGLIGIAFSEGGAVHTSENYQESFQVGTLSRDTSHVPHMRLI